MPAGRPKGAKNLKTEEEILFRERFKLHCFQGGFDRFMEELATLKGKAYVDVFLSALEFAEPKLARNELTNAGEKFEPGVIILPPRND